VRARIEAGASPAERGAQEAAHRWTALMMDMTGGDREILSAMYAKMDGTGR
jgi:MerR family transcriptional regulator, thiopeptide resistance regulator